MGRQVCATWKTGDQSHRRFLDIGQETAAWPRMKEGSEDTHANDSGLPADSGRGTGPYYRRRSLYADMALRLHRPRFLPARHGARGGLAHATVLDAHA